MDNLPRQKLLEIIKRYGRALVEEPRRCEGLMRDYFPAHRREIAVLTSALDEHVPAELLAANNAAMPRNVMLARLAQRLHHNLAMEESAARWAVHTWAFALGVVSVDELKRLEQSTAQPTSRAAPNHQSSIPTPPKSNAPSPNATPVNSTPTIARRVAQTSASFIVAADGSGDFSTINDAICHVASGARLLVRPGNYHENLIIDKSLEIVGDGALEEIIVRSTRSSCVVMQTDAATIRNLTLRGQARSGGTHDEGFFTVDIPRGRLLLEACDISSDSLSCVAIHSRSAEPVIRRCRIHHAVDSGIYAFDDARGIIEACDISENANIGIALMNGAQINVKSCHVHHCGNAGIVVWNKAASAIEDCDIYANTASDVGVSDEGTAALRRCRIHNGENSGVFVHRDGTATLEACNIYNHPQAEVAVTSGGDVRLHTCQLHKGHAHGIIIRDAGKATLEACEIFKNHDAGVRVEAGGNAIARECRINANNHVGVSCEAGGAVDVANCDLTRNRIAAWQTDYGSHVKSHNNRL